MTLSNRIATRVLVAVAAHLHVDALELRSARGTGSLLVLRGQAIWVMRKLGLSWEEVGLLFNRDYSTSKAVVATAEERLADPAAVVYREEVNACLAVAKSVIEEVQREGAPVVALVPSGGEPVVKEPPILALLKTGRDELRKSAQSLHRLSMLFDTAIIRLEVSEETPITINQDKADEEIK